MLRWVRCYFFDFELVNLYFFYSFSKGNAMNGVMNDNWQLMFRELSGAFEDTFGYIFKDISNKLFLKVPMNRIFLN